MNKFKMKKGKILVVEGTDASGKQTQTEMLLDRFNKEEISVDKISFPTYDTPSGRIVGQCYLGKDLGPGDAAWFGDADSVDPEVASLYFAANRRSELSKINQRRNSGIHQIFDRYVDSNKAHQGGKAKTRQGMIEITNFIDKLEYGLLKLPRPDLTLFLYMPLVVSQELKQRTGEKLDGHELNPDHLRRAEETFLYLCEKENWTKINCAPDGTINSLRTPENIQEEIYRQAKELFSN